MTLRLLLGAIALVALGGLPALVWRDRRGEIAGTILTLAGSLLGLTTAFLTLGSGLTLTAAVPWRLPGATFAVRLDPLAAAFLLPVFLLAGLASLYALSYWPARSQSSASRVRLFLGILVAGMATVVLAAHAILFLFAWEAMALAAFFLIAADDRDEDVRGAAWIYLVATHVGTLALFTMFTLMRYLTGSFDLGPVAGAGAFASGAIFLLAVFGFGFKAGIVPLHFWLPGAHANAPSHVSAILSGAMLKIGIYGLVRVTSWMPEPRAWWGALLLSVGLLGAVVAILLAIGESDLKRALAWSSVENVGIILAAAGVAIIGRATGNGALEALGLTAAILHVWNHSIFKGLLFFAAGSVLHATGTRRIERLGGLLKPMPFTGAAMLAGAAAASALPGANAFVSEALLYYAFFAVAPGGSVVGLGAALLALVGALAVVSFVRLTGTVLLGAPRSAEATQAHDPAASMRFVLGALALLVFVAGLLPAASLPLVSTVVPDAKEHAGAFLSAIALPVQVAAGCGALALAALFVTTRRSPRRVTWDCGYAAPGARMQYTGRSLGEWISERLVPRFLRPSARDATPEGLFPSATRFEVDTVEPFLETIYMPAVQRWMRRAMRFRWIQQGRLPSYLLYIFLTLVAGICWAVVYPLTGAWR